MDEIKVDRCLNCKSDDIKESHRGRFGEVQYVQLFCEACQGAARIIFEDCS